MDFGLPVVYSQTHPSLATAWVCWMTPKETKPRRYLRALCRTETFCGDGCVFGASVGFLSYIIIYINIWLLVWIQNCMYYMLF